MTRWDVHSTRKLIERAHGRAQLELAAPCLRSLYDREFYSRYHYQRAGTTLRRYVKAHLDAEDPISTLFGYDEPAWNRFNVVIRKVAADVTACIQSIHALPDILASAAYYSLALNRQYKPDRGRYINHAFVTNAIKDRTDLGDVHAGLRSAIRGEAYKHLAALANRSKHYSIVFPALNSDLTGTRSERHMLVLPEFKIGSKVYPQVYLNEFLPPVHEQMSKAVVETGKAIHALMRSETQHDAHQER